MDDPTFKELGRLLLILGVLVAAAGIVLLVAGRMPWVGRLPGDLVFRRGGLTIYMPVVTCILISLLLTLLLNLFLRR